MLLNLHGRPSRHLRSGVFVATVWGLAMILALEIFRVKKVPSKPQVPSKKWQTKEEQLVQKIENQLLNLSLGYSSKRMDAHVPSCVPKLPTIIDIEFNNVYWQSLRTSDGNFQLFGAYYDDRKLLSTGPLVRILGMIDRIKPRVKTHCQLWYKDDRVPAIVPILEYKYVWVSAWGNNRDGIYQPYLIACQVPKTHRDRGPPATVSLVENSCDTSSNNLRVIYDKPNVKREFAVCVKGLDFLNQDLSVRLIEWIELVGLLGADTIYFYELQAHPNIRKVLDHYTRLGKIHVTPLTLAGGQPNLPPHQHAYLRKKIVHKRQNELIPYNDCLYKHMYEYEYIALLDVDEVIMPIVDDTWSQLIKRVLPKANVKRKPRVRNKTSASYSVRNVYFLDDHLNSHGYYDDMPRYMHMLQHVYRSKNFTKPREYVKCFHDPERVIVLHNHYPLACLDGGCRPYSIDTQDAQLQHYRADCVSSLNKNTCSMYRENIVRDAAIWKYKDRLVKRVTETLKKLDLFGSS